MALYRTAKRNGDVIDNSGNPVETSPGYPEPGEQPQAPQQPQASQAASPAKIWGDYTNLNDFIGGEWGKGYNRPVDLNYWNGVIGKNTQGGNVDYDYWSKRLRGYMAGG